MNLLLKSSKLFLKLSEILYWKKDKPPLKLKRLVLSSKILQLYLRRYQISFHLKKAPNKAFKRDSCRVAFWVCSGFCGECGLLKVGLYGIHPLTRRYVARRYGVLNFLNKKSYVQSVAKD
ncbi:DUF3265 domain-containing protein, partial [Vibrio vulnificus]|nr:DUF3265 domain-containing protein [Vibrio vulnificus]